MQEVTSQVRLDAPAASALINALGGTSKVSKDTGLSSAAVSQWRKNGIALTRLLFLKQVYGANTLYQLKQVKTIFDQDIVKNYLSIP